MKGLDATGDLEVSPQARAKGLAALAAFEWQEGDLRTAADEALRMFTKLGDRWGIALAMNPVGKVRLEQHDLPAAQRAFERSLALFRELGDNWGAGIPLMTSGFSKR